MVEQTNPLQYFIEGLHRIVIEHRPLLVQDYEPKPGFFEVVKQDKLMMFHHMLEPYIQSQYPYAATVRETAFVHQLHDEIVYRYLLENPTNFVELKQFLTAYFPDDVLTQQLDNIQKAMANPNIWIEQHFLLPLAEIKDSSRFAESIAKMLRWFASQNAIYISLAPGKSVSSDMLPYLRDEIAARLSVAVPTGEKKSIHGKLERELDVLANAIQFEMMRQGVVSYALQYRIGGLLPEVEDLYDIDPSAGLALAFVAFAIHKQFPSHFYPHTACFGICDRGMIQIPSHLRDKIVEAKKRGARLFIICSPYPSDIQACLEGCQIITYIPDTLESVFKEISEKLSEKMQSTSAKVEPDNKTHFPSPAKEMCPGFVSTKYTIPKRHENSEVPQSTDRPIVGAFESTRQAPGKVVPSQAAPGQKRPDMGTILIVEDDKATHKFYKNILEPKGYAIVCAYNGEEGLECLPKINPDLIISDMSMPVMDGRSFVLRLKREAPNVPVIIISGKKGMQTDPELRMASQVHSFLVKPVNPGALLNTVQQIFACKKALQMHRVVAPSTPQTTAPLKPATAPASTPSFAGCVEHIGIFPILQMLGSGGKTGCLELRHDQQLAMVYLRDGKVIHADSGKFSDREVFYQIPQWTEGKFEFKPGVMPGTASMEEDMEFLLIEASRQFDEQQKQ